MKIKTYTLFSTETYINDYGFEIILEPRETRFVFTNKEEAEKLATLLEKEETNEDGSGTKYEVIETSITLFETVEDSYSDGYIKRVLLKEKVS